ncbi:putative facilitator of salicylate uptake [hydrothermal vent metagenome]|uniref:Putative facilitator of salicylate uptake n=1 Tax=hydrothermal vent metagenome TaxID=652676 RepID=A0A3B0XSI5_9ZZZZ
MTRGIKKSLIALAISGVFAAPSAFATNGYFAHGYSTKEKGLAGAGVAHSQDAMAIATNPAGIAGMGERMDIGAAIFSPLRSYNVSGAPAPGFGPGGPTFSLDEGNVDSNLDYFFIPHFAYNWSLDNNSSVAVAVYGNGGMNTNYKGGGATYFDGAQFVNTPGTFGAGTTGVNLAQLFINLSYATKITENHSVGAGLVFAYQTFEAKGLATFSPFSSSPGNLTNNDADASSGFGIKLGWQGKVASDITLGASYQSKLAMSEFDDYAGLFAEQGDFDIPATATLGLAWKTSKSSTLVFDIQQIYYSDVDALSNSISQLGTACVPAGSPNNPVPPQQGGSGQGPGCLGAAAGAGFGWDDMTIFKLGYEWGNDTIWRVGISQGDQPIPSSEVLFNLLAPAVMETHLTFGLTVPIGSDSEFSFAGMYAPKKSLSGANPFDPGQTIEIEMVQYEVQATYSMKF